MIKSESGACWIAGPEVRPRDVIVEFQAMRDEKDEYSALVICRPPHRRSERMDIVDQATALADLEAYDTIHNTKISLSWHPDSLSALERQYLHSRMLYARPSEDRMTVYLRPFDLIKLVMLRGHIVNRIRYPILSKDSGSYTAINDEEKD
ncbi:hypothetical protein K458DRAFT_381895 [Lentithecium fluviatile CBS 122367]|uniref:Uncharacterized protein n=1 Tax=Lentithecium fluviatile CBS 122367 TaxID=1168545 RepID=A0A6G1JPI6_9PLEO|nr:hypothetical protein K458DRAFT_381895 [Lentithecium fluviatile CBS 122367]